MIERMVIGEHIGDEWTINFGEYNHETDVTIPKSFALELLKIKEEFNRLKSRNEELERRIVCDECGGTDLVCAKGWREERNRLKAENERLKNKDFVVEAVKQVEASDAMYRTQCQIIKQKNDEITRLTASLASAHEALNYIYYNCDSEQEEWAKETAKQALSDPSGSLALEKWERMEEYITETVELVFNGAEQARKEGIPSCNFYDMERMIAKTNIPQSSFRYVGSWKAYEVIKRNFEALDAKGEGK